MVDEYFTIFAWQAPEFEYTEKKTDWYWWVGAIGIAAAGVSIFFKNYLFAGFIVIASVMMMIFARRKPDLVPVEITERGIKIGDIFYQYEDFDGFWISEEMSAEGIHLLLHSESKTLNMDHLRIDENIDLVELREFLLEVIPEVKMKETLLQKGLHKIGF